ncbi:MAG: DUF302 domain-containing protein [Thiotrichales bacterium]
MSFRQFSGLVLAASLFVPALGVADPGLMQRASPYPVHETLDRLEGVLREKGVKVFARIDHGGEAQSAGLALKPSQLLIFGNPKAGTPLMQTAPRIGLDLPMKVLAWQGDEGGTWVTWNSPDYLITRHGLPGDAAKPLGAISGLLDAALK